MTREQQQAWKKARAIVSQLTDAIDCPMDPQIIDTVVVLGLLGFPTHGSCQGHLDGGLPCPWVQGFVEGVRSEIAEEMERILDTLWQLEEAGSGMSDPQFRQLVARLKELHPQALTPEGKRELAGHIRRLRKLVREFHASIETPRKLRVIGIDVDGFRLCFTEEEKAAFWPRAERSACLRETRATMLAFTRFLKQRWLAQ